MVMSERNEPTLHPSDSVVERLFRSIEAGAVDKLLALFKCIHSGAVFGVIYHFDLPLDTVFVASPRIPSFVTSCISSSESQS